MKEQIGAWEARHQRQFLVDGVRFVDYIQNQWESYQRNKENEKDQRVSESVTDVSDVIVVPRARAGDVGVASFCACASLVVRMHGCTTACRSLDLVTLTW